jgi:ribulose-5-phosphate 4-epimerase/fuculose-1-phosphate aldolase
MTLDELSSEFVVQARSLFERGLTPGRTGNMSVLLGDRVLITPTGSSLGFLDPGALASCDLDGTHLGGARPSKELPLHLAMYRSRPDLTAVAHLHSPYAVAVSTLADLDPENMLPALTPYFIRLVGRLPLVPYFPPGSASLPEALARHASGAHAALLANHGSIAVGATLAAAVDVVEEIEASARIYLLTRGLPTRPLTPAQVAELLPG